MSGPTIVFLGGPDHGRIRNGQHAEVLLLAAGALPGNPDAALGAQVQVILPWYVEQAEELGLGPEQTLAILEGAGIDTRKVALYVIESVGDPAIFRYVGDKPMAERIAPSDN